MKNRILWMIVAVAVVPVVAIPSYAGSLKGEELLAMLSSEPSNRVHSIVEKTHAMGYLTGLLEAFVYVNDRLPETQLFCLPPSGISAGDAKTIVVEWLHAHPDRLNEPARILVISALIDAYPCTIE